jgi:hypothetical protein
MLKQFLMTLSVLTLGSLSLFPAAANAQFNFFKNTCDSTTSSSAVCTDAKSNQTGSNNSIYGKNGILTKAANIISILVGVISVIVIIIAGIQFIVATGDPARVANARNAIIYALIGLVITVSAQAIIQLVIVRL